MLTGRERSRSPAERTGNPDPDVVPIKRAPELRFQRPRVYFRFTPEKFILSVTGSNETFRSTPHMAVDRKTNLVKEIGPEAPKYASDRIVVGNGFQAQGLIIGDMDLAEIAFRYTFEIFMQRVRKGQLPVIRWLKPYLVIHPVHLDASQISELEMQALIDLGRRAGAYATSVYLGPQLNDLLLRTGNFTAARAGPAAFG